MLTSPAPSGYTYDPVTMGYRSIAGSPEDILSQRARQQSIEDATRLRNQSIQDRQLTAADSMRARLMAMLDAPATDTGGSISAGGSSGGGGSVAFNYGGSGSSAPSAIASVPEVAQVALPDNSAAAAAAFARAKDKVGATTASSITALRSALAGRGMLGGGGERRGVTNILTTGQGQLGDTSREQAISDVSRATDFAKMGYEGAISQRGQDITQRQQDISASQSAADRALQAATTGYSGAITQRGQNIGSSDAAAERQLQAGIATQQGRLAAQQMKNQSVNTLLSRLY